MNLLENQDVIKYLKSNTELYKDYYKDTNGSKERKRVKQVFISRINSGDEEALKLFYKIKECSDESKN